MSILNKNMNICRVSSVLNRDVKSFGKQYLFDGKEDSCWNSEKGTPQWVYTEFKEEISFKHLKIQFQGGFVGRNCKIKLKTNDNREIVEDFYPEDNNALQTFTFPNTYVTKAVTIMFEDSTDFFGRIVIYCIDMLP